MFLGVRRRAPSSGTAWCLTKRTPSRTPPWPTPRPAWRCTPTAAGCARVSRRQQVHPRMHAYVAASTPSGAHPPPVVNFSWSPMPSPCRHAHQHRRVGSVWPVLRAQAGAVQPKGAQHWHASPGGVGRAVRPGASRACAPWAGSGHGSAKALQRWQARRSPCCLTVSAPLPVRLLPATQTMFDSHVKNAYGNAHGMGCPQLVYTLVRPEGWRHGCGDPCVHATLALHHALPTHVLMLHLPLVPWVTTPQGQTMVRHTKRQVLGGEEVLRLPPKTEDTVAGGWGRRAEGRESRAGKVARTRTC